MSRSHPSLLDAARPHRRSEAEWLLIAESPAFRSLVARKRRLLLSGWLLVVSGYFVLPLGAALAPDWFSRPLLGAANVGLVLALGEVLLALLVAILYVRRAGRDFDRQAAALAASCRWRRGE